MFSLVTIFSWDMFQVLVIILTLVGWLPGTIYAIYIVFMAKKVLEAGLKINPDNILT